MTDYQVLLADKYHIVILDKSTNVNIDEFSISFNINNNEVYEQNIILKNIILKNTDDKNQIEHLKKFCYNVLHTDNDILKFKDHSIEYNNGNIIFTRYINMAKFTFSVPVNANFEVAICTLYEIIDNACIEKMQ
jgi:hypothetical protein